MFDIRIFKHQVFYYKLCRLKKARILIFYVNTFCDFNESEIEQRL